MPEAPVNDKVEDIAPDDDAPDEDPDPQPPVEDEVVDAPYEHD